MRFSSSLSAFMCNHATDHAQPGLSRHPFGLKPSEKLTALAEVQSLALYTLRLLTAASWALANERRRFSGRGFAIVKPWPNATMLSGLNAEIRRVQNIIGVFIEAALPECSQTFSFRLFLGRE